MKNNKTQLILFDGNAIMHRAYHALPPLKTRSGEPVNAVYGLTSMMLKVINDFKPTHLAFAFDRPEPTFRKKLFEEYQAQRDEMDEDLSPQFEKAQDVLKAMDIPIYDKAGFEADDVLATIADEANVDEVIIVTGDRDMLQLVNKKTKLLMPGRGLSDAKLYTDVETRKKMGVYADQIIDLKALMGDASDNYKGVPGVGPKTAQNWLTEYETLDNIYKNIDKLSERHKNLLIENKENAYLSQKLATIVDDVDIQFDLNHSKMHRIDTEDLLRLFDEYGFRSLKTRVKKSSEAYLPTKQQKLL